MGFCDKHGIPITEVEIEMKPMIVKPKERKTSISFVIRKKGT